MARTALTKTTKPGSYSGTAKEVAFEIVDDTNGNKFKANDNDLVLIKNDTGGAVEVTVKSTEDRYGRTEDITKSIPDGEIHMVGPLNVHGWIQSDGYIYIDSGAGIEIGIVSL